MTARVHVTNLTPGSDNPASQRHPHPGHHVPRGLRGLGANHAALRGKAQRHPLARARARLRHARRRRRRRRRDGRVPHPAVRVAPEL
jgi:hypothetical protein